MRRSKKSKLSFSAGFAKSEVFWINQESDLFLCDKSNGGKGKAVTSIRLRQATVD